MAGAADLSFDTATIAARLSSITGKSPPSCPPPSPTAVNTSLCLLVDGRRSLFVLGHCHYCRSTLVQKRKQKQQSPASYIPSAIICSRRRCSHKWPFAPRSPFVPGYCHYYLSTLMHRGNENSTHHRRVPHCCHGKTVAHAGHSPVDSLRPPLSPSDSRPSRVTRLPRHQSTQPPPSIAATATALSCRQAVSPVVMVGGAYRPALEWFLFLCLSLVLSLFSSFRRIWDGGDKGALI